MYNHGEHRSQFDGSPLASQNCTPTSGANGIREETAGRIDVSGAYVRGLVARSEETNPNTPGWSLEDLDLAMSRLSVPFLIDTGPFADIQTYVKMGYAVAVQGDSDQFSNATCSGAFDGNHCVTIHPDDATTSTKMLLADPICISRRWATVTEIKNYAEKFAGGSTIKFGVFGVGMSAVFNLERWTVPKDTKFYEAPNGVEIGKFSATTLVTTLGPRMTKSIASGFDYSWRLALILTGAVTGSQVWKLVWIRRPTGNPISTLGIWDASGLNLLLDPNGVYPTPTLPVDCQTEIESAISDYHQRVVDSIPPR